MSNEGTAFFLIFGSIGYEAFTCFAGDAKT